MSINLDLVRSIFADWEHGDWRNSAWADPQIEFVSGDWPAPVRVTGRGLMERAWRDFLGDWDDFRTDAAEYRELDDERVLVFHRFRARGKGSGIKLETIGSRGATLFHVTNGSVTKLVLYSTRDSAFADLGLTREGAPNEPD
jgi:hypothetical protein